MIHRTIGSSTARRTRNCPGWVELAKTAPQIPRSNAAADRGNRIHDALERVYEGESSGDGIEPILNLPAPDEIECGIQCMNAVEALLDEYDLTDYLVEQHVTIADDVGGTADMLAWNDKSIFVIDYKCGRVPVTYRDQFLFLASVGMDDPKTAGLFEGRVIYSAIIQPVVDLKAQVQKHSQEELHTFRVDMASAIKKVRDGYNTGHPGDHCQYCPASPTCPQKYAQVQGAVSLDFKQAHALASAADMLVAVEQWAQGVRDELFAVLDTGNPVTGWKLVQKRATRKWDNESEAYAVLKNAGLKAEDIVTPKIKTPTQVEKLLKLNKIPIKISTLVTSQSSGTTVVPESDKRSAVERNPIIDPLAHLKQKA